MRIDRTTFSHFVFVFLISLCLFSCRHDRKIDTSFYYWKTVYKQNPVETGYLRHFKTHRLYVRIMDVDVDDDALPIPISPITFKDRLPDTLQIVPVVFIVNDVLKSITKPQLNILANHIAAFVNAKVAQAGKTNYDELQMDCDWTAATRDSYFYLLKQLAASPLLKNKKLSATLRLHQLKNQVKSGIPPVSRVMLMCYNMGDLRKYGSQNSILQLSELKQYLNDNISNYPMPVDVGLPLFHWAVVFRNKQYIGLSKTIKINDLLNKNQFIFMGNTLYQAIADVPAFELKKGDVVRWESVSVADLQSTAAYIAPFIKADNLNIIYFHLDQEVLTAYTYEDLEKVNHIFN